MLICINQITIKATKEQIINILHNNFKNILAKNFKPLILQKNLFKFELITFDLPDREFMINLINQYENITITNNWSQKNGYAGIFRGTMIWKKNDFQECKYFIDYEEDSDEMEYDIIFKDSENKNNTFEIIEAPSIPTKKD